MPVVNNGDSGLQVRTVINGKAENSITINGYSLISNITLNTGDINPSINRNYVTDSQSIVISNTSGSNTGDETQGTILTKIGYTPAPLPTSLAGVGRWRALNPIDGEEAILPNAGNWGYFILQFLIATGAQNGNARASVAPGGTSIGPANINARWVGFCWRID